MVVKKIFFVIFAVLAMVSCSDDDSFDYHYELLPIEDATVPEEFEYGKIYDISLKYIVPDDCYVNSDILYEYDQDARNVALISLVLESNDCETIELEDQLTFQVHALQASPYIFRFWQGEDDTGEPIYLTVEVPVVNLSDQNANGFKATHTKM
jgi:hypothetical protein